MNDYLGMNLSFSYNFLLWGAAFCFVFIDTIQKFKYNPFQSFLPGLKLENFFDKRMTVIIVFPIIFGLVLMTYPIINICGVLTSHDLSYIQEMEFGRNIMGMRIISVLLGWRLLNLSKLNLTIYFSKDFKLKNGKWYHFIFEQYTFYSLSILSFFSLNALQVNENFSFHLSDILGINTLVNMFGVNDFEISRLTILSIISWLLSWCVGFIIDDWRIVTSYMLNTKGLILEENLKQVRRFSRAIFVLVLVFFITNIDSVFQLPESDLQGFLLILVSVIIMTLIFLGTELRTLRDVELIDVIDIRDEDELMMDEQYLLQNAKIVKFTKVNPS